jgi:hypothetical protein
VVEHVPLLFELGTCSPHRIELGAQLGLTRAQARQLSFQSLAF